jgi:hypothetical protein
MSQASTWIAMSPELQKVAERVLWGLAVRESQPRKSRMVEISKSGSGEGPGRATGRGYSTVQCRGPGQPAIRATCYEGTTCHLLKPDS